MSHFSFRFIVTFVRVSAFTRMTGWFSTVPEGVPREADVLGVVVVVCLHSGFQLISRPLQLGSGHVMVEARSSLHHSCMYAAVEGWLGGWLILEKSALDLE